MILIIQELELRVIQVYGKTTLQTGGEDDKTTLETSGEDGKTTLQTSGEDRALVFVLRGNSLAIFTHTLQSWRDEWTKLGLLHSFRV